MGNSVLMYIVNTENEIPNPISNNTAYYILNQREVRIVDNLGQIMKFMLTNGAVPEDENKINERLTECEKQVSKIIKHLTSFSEV